MSISRRRIRAIFHKEVLEFRRNRSLIAGMAIVPVLFCIQPSISVFALDASASTPLGDEHVLLYMLGIPALVPSLVAAYSVVGERQQGTLEPVLTTPVSREELMLGKALATFLPSIAVAYGVYLLFLAFIAIFALPSVAFALMRPSDLLAQLLFTPLLAGWSMWIAFSISARASDVRVAQQLATLASLPSIAVTTLVAVNLIEATLALAVTGAITLVLLNIFGWRLASAVFDREILTSGTTS